MNLLDLTVAVHEALDRAGIGHAFGGALALAYVIDPRGTVDIDVNVFLPQPELARVIEALAPLGLQPEQQLDQVPLIAGVRLRSPSSDAPVDVFPSLDPERYALIEARAVRMPFGHDGVELPFLSAEDLTIFKLSFGRDKDWVDLRRIAEARPDLDVSYVEDQLIAMRGPHMYPRIARLRSYLRQDG